MHTDFKKDNEEDAPKSWNWLTVMEGPGVSGKSCIHYGREENPIEKMNEEFETILHAKPVEYVPLPRTMTTPEIEEFLADGWGERIINNHTDENLEV